MRLIGVVILSVLASFSVFAQSKCPDGTTAARDRRLKIIEKPKASYPKGENVEAQGTVTLRVESLSSSRIGKITVIKGLPYGLTEQAIAAARRIVFEPEMKNCKATTAYIPISYSFTYY